MTSRILIFSFLLLMHGGYIFANDESSLSTDSIEGSYYELDDLVVEADRPVVTSDGEKLTYNLQEDPSSKGNTLMDALRKVPMVSVDGDNNIRINGQSSFKIYLNGKEDPSLSANYKNIFRAMPAESVVKIEVITDPGAKYDAEGTAGILNLVTVTKNSTDGYSGSATASFSKMTSGLSLYGRMRKSKLSMSANVDYADGSLFPQDNSSHMEIENMESVDSRFQTTDFRQKVKFRYLGGGLNLSYDLTDKDLLTANGNVYNVAAKLPEAFLSATTMNAAHQTTLSFQRDGKAALTNSGVTAGAAWQHNIDDNGQKTVVSYQYNHGYNHLWVDLFLQQSSIAQAVPGFEKQDAIEASNEHTLQADYIKPFAGDSHLLEAGAKAIWRDNDADSKKLTGDSETSAVESAADKDKVRQTQNVYAAYASYSGSFGNVSVKGGVRYEHTLMKLENRFDAADNFSNRLNDLVPNASVTYSFSPASNLRAAYLMRISRPSLSQVNPYRKQLLGNFAEVGNPSLTSEKSNKVSLTYSNFGRVVGGNVGIEYTSIDNAISKYYFTEGDVTYESYANIGHNRQLSLTGFLNWSVIRNMQFSVNARLTRQMFSSRQPDLSNAGWNLDYSANWSWSLPNSIRLNAYGGQSTRSYRLQGYNDGWYYYGAAVSKGFLKDDALTLTLNASNFLQGHSTYRDVTITDNMKTRMSFINRNWNVGISLSWNFGSLKGDVKKTSVGIRNDDTSSSGSDRKGGI